MGISLIHSCAYIIEIDLAKKVLNVDVSPEELEKRRAGIKRPAHPARGVLSAYRHGVGGAENGALWMFTDEED